MKYFVGYAKVVISKVTQSAICRIEIARAVLVYAIAVSRLKKLHPVRDASKRESICRQVRASQLAHELAVNKLGTI